MAVLFQEMESAVKTQVDNAVMALSFHNKDQSRHDEEKITQLPLPVGYLRLGASLTRSPAVDNVWAIQIQPVLIRRRLYELMVKMIDHSYWSTIHAPQTASDFLRVLAATRYHVDEALDLIDATWGLGPPPMTHASLYAWYRAHDELLDYWCDLRNEYRHLKGLPPLKSTKAWEEDPFSTKQVLKRKVRRSVKTSLQAIKRSASYLGCFE
ncbi:hypothetical protein GGR57DRAFT_507442 [Xylariaceae sp. FL1272]|nr:hypothetical protein GGR57DRAFT_507442 [Xylariaceae sp. FL1272]